MNLNFNDVYCKTATTTAKNLQVAALIVILPRVLSTLHDSDMDDGPQSPKQETVSCAKKTRKQSSPVDAIWERQLNNKWRMHDSLPVWITMIFHPEY